MHKKFKDFGQKLGYNIFMQLLTSEMANSEIKSKLDGSVVATIGNFDGVHVGHRHLIELTMKKAQAFGCKSLVITFEPRPIEILAPQKASSRLMSREDQFEMLQKMGVDFLFVQKFDLEFASKSFEDFIQTVLLDKLNLKGLVLGHDFAMGKDRKGTADAIVGYLKPKNISAEVSDAILFLETPISTSRIKKNLEAGDVESANRMLGRAYYLVGTVESGAKRGRTIGVPTANLSIPSSPQLKLGVYATRTFVAEKYYSSVTNVGVNPTVNDKNSSQVKVETHLFDFAQDIYGKEIRVEFVKFIRPEVKFSDFEKLKEQILLDMNVAKEILK